MSRFDGIRERIASGTGLDRVDRAEARVDSLAEAVAENLALEALLEPQVRRLEEQVAGLLEHGDGVEA